MEAGKSLVRIVAMMAVVCGFSSASTGLFAANYRTQNFIVHAPTVELAQAVGDAAEHYRRELSEHWLGGDLRPWPTPCPIRVVTGPNLAAQGVTTYNRSPVRDFQMEVVGTPERILDSVLPHEVTHTVLATHFGRPLPRWADEGICTTVEHASERAKHEAKLREFLASRRGIAMNRMFLLTEYPNDVLPLYAQGYSVCRFLIEQKGPQAFIAFLEGYMRQPSWTDNVRHHYGYESLGELQEYWLGWVADGSGPVDRFVKSTSPPSLQPEGADSLALASASGTPTGPVASGTRPQTLLASAAGMTQASGEAGWYLRRKQGVADPAVKQASNVEPPKTAIRDGGATAELLATPLPPRDPGIPGTLNPIPPSVRGSGWYSAAQPQPEQSYSGDFGSGGYNAGASSPLRTSVLPQTSLPTPSYRPAVSAKPDRTAPKSNAAAPLGGWPSELEGARTWR